MEKENKVDHVDVEYCLIIKRKGCTFHCGAHNVEPL